MWPAKRTRHSILELLQGTHEISAGGQAQYSKSVRRPIHSSTSHAARPGDAAVKADGVRRRPGGMPKRQWRVS